MLSVANGNYTDMIITCDTCALVNIGCSDCVLTYLLAPKRFEISETEAQKIDAGLTCEIPDATAEAIDLLSSRGIVRPLRYNKVAQA